MRLLPLDKSGLFAHRRRRYTLSFPKKNRFIKKLLLLWWLGNPILLQGQRTPLLSLSLVRVWLLLLLGEEEVPPVGEPVDDVEDEEEHGHGHEEEAVYVKVVVAAEVGAAAAPLLLLLLLLRAVTVVVAVLLPVAALPAPEEARLASAVGRVLKDLRRSAAAVGGGGGGARLVELVVVVGGAVKGPRGGCGGRGRVRVQQPLLAGACADGGGDVRRRGGGGLAVGRGRGGRGGGGGRGGEPSPRRGRGRMLLWERGRSWGAKEGVGGGIVGGGGRVVGGHLVLEVVLAESHLKKEKVIEMKYE